MLQIKLTMLDVKMLKNLDQSHNGSSIHKEVNRLVLNFLFYFFYDKISQALKSTEPQSIY